MKRNPWLVIMVLFVLFGSLWAMLLFATGSSWLKGGSHASMKWSSKPSVMRLELKGVIMDGKRILEPLLEFAEEENIKAVVVEVNSPGGVVGPSQELYEELKRVRDELKKPVVFVTKGVMASGAYYAAAAGTKIVAQPGALIGSIGVIIPFTNLEKLYDWAKVNRFALTTGKYKDSGAEYRSMREDEKQVFQTLIDDVLEQFVDAVATGRNMDRAKAKELADGRIWTGRQAKELGLIDEVGTFQQAYDMAAELAGLDPENYEIFEAPKEPKHWWEMLAADPEDETTTSWDGLEPKSWLDHGVDRIFAKAFKPHWNNQPMLLWTGAL